MKFVCVVRLRYSHMLVISCASARDTKALTLSIVLSDVGIRPLYQGTIVVDPEAKLKDPD